MRPAAHPLHIFYRDFCYRGAFEASQRRNKTVHLSVERDALQDVTAVGFEGRTKIVQRHTASARHQPIRDLRWEGTPHTVLTMLPPATDDVIALRDLIEKARDVLRLMLQVTIHGDDHVARGPIQ